MLLSAQTMSRESSSTITPPEPAIDPAAARESKSIGISSIDISRSIDAPSGCFCLSLNRSPAGNDRLQFSARFQSAGHFVNQLSYGHRADFDFEIARPLHVAADADNSGAGIVWAAESGIVYATHGNDVFYVAKRLDVVHDGRAHVETEHSWEIGWLDPRITPFAFERLD